MSDDKNPGVDPRFDPAFQRGFDGTVSSPAPARPARPRKSALAKPVPEDLEGPPAMKATVPELVEGPPPMKSPVAETTAVPELVEGPHHEPASADEHHADPTPSRNPYLLFLGIIAVALFATGIWLFVRSGSEFNSKVVQSQGDYMSLTATIYAAPFIAMLGAMTAIGVLFVFALRYRGRNTPGNKR